VDIIDGLPGAEWSKQRSEEWLSHGPDGPAAPGFQDEWGATPSDSPEPDAHPTQSPQPPPPPYPPPSPQATTVDDDSTCTGDVKMALALQEEEMASKLDPQDVALADSLHAEEVVERMGASDATVGDTSTADGQENRGASTTMDDHRQTPQPDRPPYTVGYTGLPLFSKAYTRRLGLASHDRAQRPPNTITAGARGRWTAGRVRKGRQ
jgi:hypothetical protein